MYEGVYELALVRVGICGRVVLELELGEGKG